MAGTIKLSRKLTCFLIFSLIFIYFIFPESLQAQNTGIGSSSFIPNPSAMLEIQAGAANDKGLLIPRITYSDRIAITPLPAAAQGLLIYQTDAVGVSLEGFYYNISTTTIPNWVYLSPGSGSAWGLTGNAGTNAGTNFIGTTDLQDWVISTDGNERARFLKSGEVRINTTNVNAGEIFTVVGSGVPGALTSVGTNAINGYSTLSGIGVYGQNNANGVGVKGVTSGSGIGVRGENVSPVTSASSTTYGIYGSNMSIPSGNGTTVGVAGYATSGTGDGRGVQGQSESSSGRGVAGFNTAPSAANIDANGVFGQTSSQAAAAVEGRNLSASGLAHGVEGTSNSVSGGAGVKGLNNTSPGSGGRCYGIWGSANGMPSGSGIVYGVRGDCASPSGIAFGVSGYTATALGSGVIGFNAELNGTGVIGKGNNIITSYLLTTGSGGVFVGANTGAYCIANATDTSTGVLGVSNGAPTLTFGNGSGVSGSSTLIGVAGFSTSGASEDRAGGYFETKGASSYAYVGALSSLGVQRKIEGTGTVNTTVKDLNNKLVVLSCPEAPENFFQDFGKGKLTNGKAHIVLDPVFTKNIVVNESHPLRVFIQLGGDCKGVFVSNESATGFDVTELQNGSSDAPFTWFVTANRADEINNDGTISRYSNERFAPAMGPGKSILQQKVAITSQETPAETVTPKPVKPASIEKKNKD